jgi:WD40 repeat protein
MEGLQRGDPASVGSYRLLGRLGAGGMGQVFLGVSPSGRRVAVKLIHPVHAGTEHFRERFAREIEAARRVGGFHTAPVVDADPHAETPWMVTAYIDGPSLQQAVGRHGPLPPGQVRALGAGLAEGLAAIHAHGLVHRDLKPGNVIMAEDGPRIIDFGIARAIGATTLTSAGSMVGTFAYMSPEQVRADPVMPPSDVFSLGSVLAFAATGRPPFGSDTAATVMFRIVSQPPDLAGLADRELRSLIEACLAKSPADRPQVPVVLAALTGRGPVPALVVPRTAPAADDRHPQTQAYPSLRVPPGTNAGRDGPAGSDTAAPGAAQPGTVPSRTVPPVPLGRARSAGRRHRRRRATLVAAVAVIAVLAAVVPILLTGNPGTAAGHGPSTGPELTFHAPNYAELSGVAFSPDGGLLAAYDSQETFLWDIANGKLTALRDPVVGVNGMAFSPDGKLLAHADVNNAIYLWNLATGKLTATLTSPSAGGEPEGVAFSPDGKLLASAEASFQTDVWDIATGRLIHVLTDASGISGVAFSPDGKLLASAGGPTFLWDVATGRRVATLYDPGGQGVNAVAFSPDGKLLAAAGGSTFLWNVATHAVVATLTAPGQRQYDTSVAFSPDGKLIAIVNGNGLGSQFGKSQTYLWNVATGKLVGTVTDPTTDKVSGVAFSPDGKLLAVSDLYGDVYVWAVSHLIS